MTQEDRWREGKYQISLGFLQNSSLHHHGYSSVNYIVSLNTRQPHWNCLQLCTVSALKEMKITINLIILTTDIYRDAVLIVLACYQDMLVCLPYWMWQVCPVNKYKGKLLVFWIRSTNIYNELMLFLDSMIYIHVSSNNDISKTKKTSANQNETLQLVESLLSLLLAVKWNTAWQNIIYTYFTV